MPDAADKIKIVYLIDHLGSGGGTENQLILLIRHLDRSRFAPYLFILRAKEQYQYSELNCPVRHFDFKKLQSIKAIRALFEFVRFLRQNRVNVLQLFFVDSNIFGAIAGRLASVPTIVVSRRDMGWWYHQKRRYLTNLLNRMTHFCIANAEAVKRAVAAMETIPAERIRVIHNGVPPRNPNPRSSLTKAAFGIPETAPVVGVVAHLRPIKRVDYFLRAAARLKRTDCHFVILGGGILEADLKRLAQELGLASRAHFRHTIEQTRDIIDLFDVGVLTSASEGLSNVLIEYALAGLPAVAFDTGGNGEVIVDGHTGHLVAPYDEAVLAEKIDHLLDHVDLAHRMGRAAQERAREEFAVETMVKQTEQFYLEIAGQKVPGAAARKPSPANDSISRGPRETPPNISADS